MIYDAQRNLLIESMTAGVVFAVAYCDFLAHLCGWNR